MLSASLCAFLFFLGGGGLLITLLIRGIYILFKREIFTMGKVSW
jgi:hypothetical protein